jgi:hypothetical protein
MTNSESERKRTSDHEKIQSWVEERDGKPAIVSGTKRDTGGVLRIDFGEPGRSLEQISWEEFFTIFDENNLAFLYQDGDTDDKPSHFNKFVLRDRD